MRRYWMLTPLLFASLVHPAVAEKSFSLTEQSTSIRNKTESLQWVPETVTVINKDQLESTYRRDLEDLEIFVPGLIVDGLGGTPQGAAIAMRGIGSGVTEISKGFEPAVAVLIDDVYIGTHTGQMQRLFDLERVEVARGSQNMHVGAPNVGGVIKLVRTKPTGEWGTNLRISAGDFSKLEADAVLNFPITDGLAGKLTLTAVDQQGDQVNNVINFQDENTEERVAISLSLLWDDFDNVSVQYTFDREDDDSATPALLNLSRATDLLCANATMGETCASDLGPAVPQTGDIEDTAQNFSNQRGYKGNYHTLRIEGLWGNHTITSITALRDSDETTFRDMDASQVDFYSLIAEQEYSQFSQELRVSRQYSENLYYTVGGHLMKQDYEIEQQELFILNQLGTAGLAAPNPVAALNFLNSETDSTHFSIFSNFDYRLTEQWTTDFGLRYTSVEKSFDHSPIGTAPPAAPLVSINDKDWDEVMGSIGIAFQVDSEAMIYSRLAQGFRPGGFSENALSFESADPYRSETIGRWEIGMKSEWFEDRLRINIAYHAAEYDDKTEEFVAPVAPGRLESVVQNVASVTSKGWDLEWEYVPLNNWFIRGSYNHMNNDYEAIIPDLTNPGTDLEITAFVANYSPKDSATLSTQYSFNFAEGVINAYAGYKYYSDYHTNNFSRLDIAKVRNYGTWDVSVEYVWHDWTFRLFSQNIRDKRFLMNGDSVVDADIVPLAPTATSPTGLVTHSEYNPIRHSGLELIYRPDISNLF